LYGPVGLENVPSVPVFPNVYSRKKLREKLDYMHANPVVERLVSHPKDWPWSSWSFYARGEGILKMDPM